MSWDFFPHLAFSDFGDQLFPCQDCIHDLLSAAQVGDPVLESFALQTVDLAWTLFPNPDLKCKGEKIVYNFLGRLAICQTLVKYRFCR